MKYAIGHNGIFGASLIVLLADQPSPEGRLTPYRLRDRKYLKPLTASLWLKHGGYLLESPVLLANPDQAAEVLRDRPAYRDGEMAQRIQP